MSILLWIFVGFIGLVVVFLLAIQFIKIGRILKNKIPFLYAIYLVFWILFFGVIAISTVFGLYNKFETRQEYKIMQERQEQIHQLAINYAIDKERANREIYDFEIFCGNCYLSSEDKFILLLLYRKNTASFYKKAKQLGFSGEEIAKYYDLYIFNEFGIKEIIAFGKQHNERNDKIYKTLLESGLLDEYLAAGNKEKQIRKLFDLE